MKIKMGGTCILIAIGLFYLKELLVRIKMWYPITDVVVFLCTFFGMNGIIILEEDI